MGGAVDVGVSRSLDSAGTAPSGLQQRLGHLRPGQPGNSGNEKTGGYKRRYEYRYEGNGDTVKPEQTQVW